jgi:hypothetical protein
MARGRFRGGHTMTVQPIVIQKRNVQQGRFGFFQSVFLLFHNYQLILDFLYTLPVLMSVTVRKVLFLITSFIIFTKNKTNSLCKYIAHQLSKPSVSGAVVVVVEFLKLLYDRAAALVKSQENKAGELIKSHENNNNYIDTLILENIGYHIKENPATSEYIRQYILPSMQFTAIFQLGGGMTGLFQPQEPGQVMQFLGVSFKAKTLTTMHRGVLKAGSSAIIVVLGKWEKDTDIQIADAIIPFSKEPVVSVCKIIIPDQVVVPIIPYNIVLPENVKKFICNSGGELSNNAAKALGGKQVLSMREMSIAVPIKSLWKTFHQKAEGKIVELVGDPLGFYLGSFVSRSWGNNLTEAIVAKDADFYIVIAQTWNSQIALLGGEIVGADH